MCRGVKGPAGFSTQKNAALFDKLENLPYNVLIHTDNYV